MLVYTVKIKQLYHKNGGNSSAPLFRRVRLVAISAYYLLRVRPSVRPSVRLPVCLSVCVQLGSPLIYFGEIRYRGGGCYRNVPKFPILLKSGKISDIAWRPTLLAGNVKISKNTFLPVKWYHAVRIADEE